MPLRSVGKRTYRDKSSVQLQVSVHVVAVGVSGFGRRPENGAAVPKLANHQFADFHTRTLLLTTANMMTSSLRRDASFMILTKEYR